MSNEAAADSKAFNEDEYLAANPDVAESVASGRFESGWAHYDLFGRHEGRALLPAETESERLSFDEEQYIAANPDVAAAVASNRFESGWAHYDLVGRDEERPRLIAETRRGRLLTDIDLATSTGLEIGALDRPLVQKSEGDIFYVDYADTEHLRKSYKTDPNVDIDKIVQVNGIWGEKTLPEALGVGRRVDYVLASHVVEHVPDIVSWLQEISMVLKDDGTLRLAVPDRRYTFDYTRQESVLSDALDAFLRKARAPLPRQILDYCLNSRKVDLPTAWNGTLDVASLKRDFSDKSAFELAEDSFRNGTYHDVHCWVFIPQTFVALMRGLVEFRLIDLRCEFITRTRRGQLEFLVAMQVEKDRAKALASWQNPTFV